MSIYALVLLSTNILLATGYTEKSYTQEER